IGMPGAERFFPDCQGASVKGFRLGVIPQLMVEQPQIIDASGSVGMLGAVNLFAERDASFCERNRLLEFSSAVEASDSFVQSRSLFGIICALHRGKRYR